MKSVGLHEASKQQVLCKSFNITCELFENWETQYYQHRLISHYQLSK